MEQIEQVAIETLIPYKNNARLHSDKQIGQIAESIKSFGFNNPVLIDSKNNIIAGHGRVQAAKRLKMKTVPTIKIEHLTEEQKKAFIIADNQIAQNSSFDKGILSLEIASLKNSDINLNILGFDDRELEELEFDLVEDIKEQNTNELDLEEKFEVLVELKSVQEQEELYEELENRGYQCKVLSF